MKTYIRDSINKFKSDALSKMIYDILKWLILVSIIFALSYLIPKDTTFSTIISETFSINLYWIILYSLFLIIITIISVNIISKRKYVAMQLDNFTDELTGLKNYKALDNYFPLKISEIKKANRVMSIILIDIDDFKKINDSVGYNTADKILKKVGEILGTEKRSTDETFRKFQRGDEFVVVLDDTSLSSAILAAERRRKLIEKTSIFVENKSFNLTVSCGVTEFRPNEDNYETIIDRVSEALREAKKREGKNYTKSIA